MRALMMAGLLFMNTVVQAAPMQEDAKEVFRKQVLAHHEQCRQVAIDWASKVNQKLADIAESGYADFAAMQELKERWSQYSMWFGVYQDYGREHNLPNQEKGLPPEIGQLTNIFFYDKNFFYGDDPSRTIENFFRINFDRKVEVVSSMKAILALVVFLGLVLVVILVLIVKEAFRA